MTLDRRAFLAALTVTGLSVSRARADQAKSIGWLTYFGVGEEDLIVDTVNALGHLGWKRGETLKLTRSIPLKPTEIDGAARELVDLGTDLILVNGETAAAAIRSLSKTQPMLFYNAFDPVRSGIIQSLARPGGTTTGLVGYPISLGPKWVQLLQTLVPGLDRLAVVSDPTISASGPLLDAIMAHSASARLEVVGWPAETFSSIEKADHTLQSPYPGAILAIPDPVTIRVRRNLTLFAVRRMLPAMFWYSDAVRTNALISYGPDRTDLAARLADRVHRILRGTAPAAIPVEEPIRYELAVNRLIARQFGIEIPVLLGAQADVIID